MRFMSVARISIIRDAVPCLEFKNALTEFKGTELPARADDGILGLQVDQFRHWTTRMLSSDVVITRRL